MLSDKLLTTLSTLQTMTLCLTLSRKVSAWLVSSWSLAGRGFGLYGLQFTGLLALFYRFSTGTCTCFKVPIVYLIPLSIQLSKNFFITVNVKPRRLFFVIFYLKFVHSELYWIRKHVVDLYLIITLTKG